MPPLSSHRFHAGAVLFLAGLAGAGTAAAQSSTFNTGDENWSIADLPFAVYQNPPPVLNIFTPDWNATGGNPVGYISHLDSVTEEWFWFAAPSLFLGNQSAAYGGTLRFDLQTTANKGVPYPDVILVGGGHSLFHFGNPPPTMWASRSVALVETGWQHENNVAASQSDFQATLGALQALYINGDWLSGLETTGLDNVVMTPEPASLVGLSLAGLLVWRSSRRM